MLKVKRLYKYILLIGILLFFFSCALDVSDKGFDYLVPPVISRCYRVSGDAEHIYVDFKGYNNEYYFDGYNVYVEITSITKSKIKKYKQVQIDEPGYASANPSFPLSPDDYDPDMVRTIILNQYWCPDYPDNVCSFDPGTTYYILLCSHHRQSGVNEDGCSNQVSIEFE